MGRDADCLGRVALEQDAAFLEEARERGDVVDEPPLLGPGRRAAERRMGVEDRKQGHANARLPGGGENAPGHLRRRLIGRTVGRVMEIMELGDCGEPGLQHLDIGLRGDRLDVVRRH